MLTRHSKALDVSLGRTEPWEVSPRRTKRPPRYSQDAVRREILGLLADCGVEPKELYTAIGMPQPDWSRRLNGRAFKLEELADIADFFAERKKRALTGWPFVSLAESAILDAALGRSRND